MSSNWSPSNKMKPGSIENGKSRFRRFANQSFRRLAKRSADVGLLFTDDQFQHSDRLIYQTSQFRTRFNIGKVVWKRPKQILEDSDYKLEPCLIPKLETENKHLFVGHSPNQWLVAAALSIAQHRSLLDQLINIDEQNFRENGIVRFNIWQMGIWHKVVVDDRLPTIDCQPIFTRPLLSYPGWWVAMLEKAYAKLYGSYEAMITAGSLQSALIDFSGGGSVQTIDPGKLSAEDVWHLIAKEFQSKSLMILKTKESKSPSESSPFGLISNRYYLISNIKKPMGSLKRFISNSPKSNDNLPILITNTIADGVKNSKSNHKKSLQEFWILSNNIPTLFDSLTICRQSLKDHVHQLFVNQSNENGLQFSFDVTASNSLLMQDTDVQVCLNLIQNSSSIIPIGLRIYSIELNRKFKVHNFWSLPLIDTVDPVHSRNLITSICLPSGRYLLKPICHQINALLVSIHSTQVQHLRRLSLDMPRHQLFSFSAPIYPNSVTRITVLEVQGLERQDRFGSANPYCIIRCGRKFIKSSIQYETLEPKWKNFSAIFYHWDNEIQPIAIEIWHRSILVDYLIGVVKFKPKIIEFTETETIDTGTDLITNRTGTLKQPEYQEDGRTSFQTQNSEPIFNPIVVDRNSLQSDSSMPIDMGSSTCLRLPLTDKKCRSKRPGFVLFNALTVEDLRHF